MRDAYGEQPRQPALDGLRGIAIIAVVVSHFSELLPPGAVRVELSYGWAGVDLFFVLSGFLITRILLETKGRQGYLTMFWVRRALRIFPLYFATLIVALVVGEQIPALRAGLPPAQDWPLYFLFLSNWTTLWHSWAPNMLVPLWSVALEEQFYLIWPICVLLLSTRWLSFLSAGLACGMVLFRISCLAGFGARSCIGLLTFTRADGLMLGALAAVLLSKGISPRNVRFASIGSFAALELFWAGTVAYRADPSEFCRAIGFSLLALGFAAGVLAVAATRSRTAVTRVLETEWLTNVGKYSFGIYLFHVPLFQGFNILVSGIPRLSHGGFVLGSLEGASLWALTYYLAKLSFEKFEAPLLRLKRYARPGRLRPVFGVAPEPGLAD